MIDQSHIDKPKIEAMLQTAVAAQELYAKAAAVDHEKLARRQERNEQVDGEECLRQAFFADVRPAILEWRRQHNLPLDPLMASSRSLPICRHSKCQTKSPLAFGIYLHLCSLKSGETLL